MAVQCLCGEISASQNTLPPLAPLVNEPLAAHDQLAGARRGVDRRIVDNPEAYALVCQRGDDAIEVRRRAREAVDLGHEQRVALSQELEALLQCRPRPVSSPERFSLKTLSQSLSFWSCTSRPLPVTGGGLMTRVHRRRQLELRIALGQGRPEPSALVFSTLEGAPLSPDNLSRDWRRVTAARQLPKVPFHALRHSHASALIASGVDVLTVSRRLGHGSAVVTLTTYAHLFEKTDTTAASAIEAALRTIVER